jgi:hypothetical protein
MNTNKLFLKNIGLFLATLLLAACQDAPQTPPAADAPAAPSGAAPGPSLPPPPEARIDMANADNGAGVYFFTFRQTVTRGPSSPAPSAAADASTR